MSNQDCPKHVTGCEPYLSQGDIFQIDIVAPMADPEKLIFRTVNGRHASNIKPNGTNGKIFDYDELLIALEKLPPEQRLLPFQRTSDGKYERVLVYADLLKYFVILSQTCDISGVDRPAKPTCAIVPIITLAQHCQRQIPLPYKDPNTNQQTHQMVSIPDFINERFDSSFKKEVTDDLAFPEYLRSNIKAWQKASKGKIAEQQLINGIKNSLNSIMKNEPYYSYYIAPDEEHKVPESYVDFCRLYTVSTDIIENLKDRRIATINTLYREEFARKFAEYYARIATPQPMRGKPIK